MPFLLRGALIEYGSDFLGPLPNVVIFQFNPEKLTRTIQIPQRPTSGASRETSQAGEPSFEKISLVAHFSAADGQKNNNILARTTGVGPRLAALEQMVYPSARISGLIGAAIDAIGGALGAGGDDGPRQSIPREKYPRILFIWGPFRILPVIIDSMVINELQYDFILNPTQAEITLGLTVNAIDKCSDDKIAKGALEYSKTVKEAQAILNLANTIEQVAELIPF